MTKKELSDIQKKIPQFITEEVGGTITIRTKIYSGKKPNKLDERYCSEFTVDDYMLLQKMKNWHSE